MPLISIIAEELRIEPEYVKKLSASASHLYKVYSIPKATGGKRTICHPAKELKALQYWLRDKVLLEFQVHKSATAYMKKTSIKINASAHLYNQYLLRMDFRNFFESISSADFRKKVPIGTEIAQIKITEDDMAFMCKILFRHEKMTIGAPSSPALSNLLMYDFDHNIYSHCQRNQVAYTRYADDMFFSTKAPNRLKEIERYVVETGELLDCPAELKINGGKTRHTSRKGHRYVTGLTLTSENRISLGRSKKREIKSRIYEYLKENYIDDQDADRSYLRGFLSYARDVEPQFINRLIKKYGASEIESIMK